MILIFFPCPNWIFVLDRTLNWPLHWHYIGSLCFYSSGSKELLWVSSKWAGRICTSSLWRVSAFRRNHSVCLTSMFMNQCKGGGVALSCLNICLRIWKSRPISLLWINPQTSSSVFWRSTMAWVRLYLRTIILSCLVNFLVSTNILYTSFSTFKAWVFWGLYSAFK